MNFSRRSPIIARYFILFTNHSGPNTLFCRFANSHTSTVSFTLTDPHLRRVMATKKVYWNCFQTRIDRNISFVCSKLRRAQLIHSQVIDKWHITCVIPKTGDWPIPITCMEDFVDVFNPAMLAQVNGIIHQHMGNTTDDLEEAALTPITPTLAPAADTSHPSDPVAGNSAQAMARPWMWKLSRPEQDTS